jgi:transcriptional regulator with XRE-family HTH domain
MLSAGQEVTTKYGDGVVVSVGAVKPHVYVRIHSSSRIYVLDSTDISEIQPRSRDEWGTRDVIRQGDKAEQPTEKQIDSCVVQEINAAALPNDLSDIWRGLMKNKRLGGEAPLAVFVRARLAELGMKQSEFCRLTGFDQGLLSKIQSSMISKLSLETALRLALGLSVPPERVFALIGRPDLNELIMKAYGVETEDAPRIDAASRPAPVLEITQLASQANELGHDLGPLIEQLQNLISPPDEQTRGHSAGEIHRQA